MSKALISGSSGFIGLNLIQRVEADLIPHEEIIWGVYGGYDKMFFLSAYGNMAHHDDYKEMVNANVANVVAVLNDFNGWFCYLSSSSVMLPVQTPYSRTKRAAEEILQALPDLQSCIVRPYSVTGVGEQKEHLIPTLIRSCMEGEKMQFSPDPVHDFVDVEDVVDALVKLSEEKFTGMVELGNGHPYTNREVLELVELVTGKKAKTEHVYSRLRPYDTTDWYCKTPFFHKPKPLLKSIEEMVEAYREV